jgi:hypothetical protein
MNVEIGLRPRILFWEYSIFGIVSVQCSCAHQYFKLINMQNEVLRSSPLNRPQQISIRLPPSEISDICLEKNLLKIPVWVKICETLKATVNDRQKRVN